MSKHTETKTIKDQTRPWEKPELKDAGNVADVLQGGGGKLSIDHSDPGDPRKPSGQA